MEWLQLNCNKHFDLKKKKKQQHCTGVLTVWFQLNYNTLSFKHSQHCTGALTVWFQLDCNTYLNLKSNGTVQER